MFDQPQSVWAADLNNANAHLDLARRLQSETGQDPLFMPWSMGEQAIDFSHMPRELMLRYAQANMPKSTARRLTRDIRGVVPEFVDLNDPQSIQAFLGATGKQRRELNRLLDQYRDRGGLGLGAARMATTDPGQLDTPLTSLRNVGRIDPSREAIRSSHPSYGHSVPGAGIGRLVENNIGALDLLPDLRRSADPFDFPRGVVPGEPSPLRALQMSPKGGIITEDILRNIEKRFEVPKREAVDEAIRRQMGVFRDTAQATSERVPYVDANHLPGLLQADDAARRAYSLDPRLSYVNESGDDILYSALNVPQRATQEATGFYIPPNGILETNLSTVGKPFVRVSGGDIDPASRDMLNLAEMFRNYVDAQGAGAYHMNLFDVPTQDLSSLFTPMEGAVDADVLIELQRLAKQYGLKDISDTGEGVTITNFENTPLREITQRGLDEGLYRNISDLLGGSAPRESKVVSGYLPVLERAGSEGSGVATSRLLNLADKYPKDVLERLSGDPAVRQRVAAAADVDEELAARYGGARQDIQTARRILSEKGLSGLKEAQKQGIVLPAVAALLISGYGLQPEDDAL
jgi:hypothetical protein